MLLDTSVINQAYVEDCEVCCNPIQISLYFEANYLTSFEAISLGQ